MARPDGRRAAADRQGPHDPRRQRPSPSCLSARACSEVLLAAEKLSAYGLSPTIADARFAKPLDHAT